MDKKAKKILQIIRFSGIKSAHFARWVNLLIACALLKGAMADSGGKTNRRTYVTYFNEKPFRGWGAFRAPY